MPIRGERGSAIAEFTMVAALLVVLAIGVLQLALTLYVRNVVLSGACEGARVAARADATGADGVARAEELIGSSLTQGYAQDVVAAEEVVGGVRVVRVTVTSPLPVIGLLGPAGALTVSGRAVKEIP